MITRRDDGCALVTAYNGWFPRVPAAVTVEPQADVRDDALAELWKRHHQRRTEFLGRRAAAPVAATVDRLVVELTPILAIHV